ncbi:lipopolysaccharide core heptose(II) kinase RfaY [Parachaetomium inaequale]|uniref:Lipopolysaccharide core heptose(II) kinase RfaY n=1 Tax=Parachaetomium inaequale TaxID=2588326 RepID=A0AAN6P7Q1_9PEZI|nr:lipopolysaccharide core heptose(II) kinase RfaY [Parachaetomium inaequale]
MDANDAHVQLSHHSVVGKYEIELPKYRRPGEPQNYRLSPVRIETPKPVLPSWPVYFSFRTRYPSAAASFLGCCLTLLPNFVRSWVNTLFPEWFLPSHVVLKTQKQGEDETVLRELFETEVQAYDRLKALQGVAVPKCHGVIHYNGSKAMILERLDGVHHDDPQPANFQHVDGKIMVLDLERVMFNLSADDMGYFLKTNIEDLAIRYRDMQVNYRHEGLLEAA